MSRCIIGIAIGIVLVAYFLLWPVPITPVAWHPPAAPSLDAEYAVNQALASAERWGEGVGTGPESPALDAQGNIYVGYDDGRIVRFDPKGQQPKTLANTGGRPLGMDFDATGNLIVADALRGLLSLAPDGTLTLLTARAEGGPFRFTDDVDVAPSGAIYFTDASRKFGPALHAMEDLLEHGAHGRLLRYDPATRQTEVLLAGLQFANGVAVAPDEAFVLVAQTGSYNILRYWLKGPNQGNFDVFANNLPGIPDGVSCNGKDTFWVALFSPRNALLDWTADKPLLRSMNFRLPRFLQPRPVHHAFVLAYTLDGKLKHNLQDATEGNFSPITNAEEWNGTLYLGSLTATSFARFDLKDRPR